MTSGEMIPTSISVRTSNTIVLMSMIYFLHRNMQAIYRVASKGGVEFQRCSVKNP